MRNCITVEAAAPALYPAPLLIQLPVNTHHIHFPPLCVRKGHLHSIKCKLQGLVDSRAALDSVGSDSDASAASGFSPAVSPAASPCLHGGHLVYRTPFFWQRVSNGPEGCVEVNSVPGWT